MVLCAGVLFANAQLIKNNFLAGYTVGQDLEKGAYANTTQDETNPIKLNQWNLSGKTGNNDQSPESVSPKLVAPLTYASYIESGKNVAIDLLKLTTGGRTDIYSLADDNTYGAGTYYVAFMFNVSAATTSGAEFISLDGNYTGNAQRARLGIKGIDETTYAIGLGDGGAPSVFSGIYNFGTTYLAVLKVVIDGAGLGTTSVYINPNVAGTEPASSTVTPVGITGTALKAIRGLVIRQRSTLAAQLGGLRFAKTWTDALGQGASSAKTANADKGEVISVNYYTTTGVQVQEPSNGVYIQKLTYSNGAVETIKILK